MGKFFRARRWLAAFVWQQAWSCVFAAGLFFVLAVSRHIPLFGIARYDFILLFCLLLQFALWRTRWETTDELKVIAVFHVLGFGLEQFKTHMGCWAYPGDALTKIAGVPLYSGFMYASVASYLCQAWRRFQVRLIGWPSARQTVPLAAMVYVNFFTEHVFFDLRWVLAAIILFVFRRTRAQFVVDGRVGDWPLSVCFLCIGTGVWIAENIATRLGAWQYPDQHGAWQWVHVSKISSWSLLGILTFLIVAQLKHVKAQKLVVPGSISNAASAVH